uniref:GW182 middle domain-containing protein n=1 Tax=Plectus sambesii TaxID=2011161 RepID=A0A914VRN2_9BILA
MWGVDDTSAETMAMNPWNPGPQAQVWQGIPRGAQNGPGAFPPSGVQGGGPPAMRGGPRWDPAGAQAPGWHTPQNPSGGWGTGPPAPSQQPNGGWAHPQQTQWGAGQASHSYADTAKKNMPPAPMPVRGGAGQPQRMDSASGWGSGVKVDQLTPWDTAPNAAQAAAGPVAHMGGHEAKSNEWGGGGGSEVVAAAAARPNNYDNNDMNWHGAGGTAHWGGGGGGGAAAPHGGPPPSATSTGTWGGSGGGGGGSGGGGGHHHDQHPGRLQYDPNPQTPGPWVPPQPTEMNNDMMWHDPNPKQKKVQRDTGTAVWGDPTSQVTNDIRRWKDTDTDDVVLPPGAAAASSVWDSTPASQLPTMGWGDPSPTAASAPNNGADQWANSAAVSGSSWDSAAAKPANAPGLDDAPTASSGNDDAFGNASNGSGSNAQKTLNGTTTQSVMQTLAEQMKRGGAGSADGGNLASLTQQIADQLRVAVSKGLININILNQPLPQQTLVLLNQLLQRVPKLEQANVELGQLRQRTAGQTMNAAQQAEYDRLMHEIQALQAEISGLQTKINDNAGLSTQGAPAGAAAQNGARLSAGADSQQSGSAATTPMDGGSKLLQWKNGDSDKLAGSASDSNLPNLVGGVQSMSINGGDKDAWQSGKLDWSPPGSADLGTSVDTMKSDDGVPAMMEKANSLPAPSSQHQSGSATPTPPVDEGPQEFVPGKKWEWRDPKAVADDPNATPGNCKQNPLLSSSGGNSLGSGFMNFAGGSGGNPLGGNITPTKMNDPRFGMGGGWNGAPGGFGGANAGGDPWTRSRPPSNLGAPYPPAAMRAGGPGGPFNRSMSSPGQSAFQPYGAWIIVHTSNQNEQQLRAICGKIGQVASFIMPPGSNMACIKYADMIPDQAFIRLKSELGPVGVQMQVVSDNEVERIMMKGMGRQPPAMMPPQPQPLSWQASEPGWGGPPSNPAFPGMMHDPLSMSAGMPPPALHEQFMPPPGSFPHDDRGMMHDPLSMSAGMPPPALHEQFMPPPGSFPHDDRPF